MARQLQHAWVDEHPEKTEIKISFDRTVVEAARAAFVLDAADAEQADIWFCDQVVALGDTVRLTLAEHDLIVRLRRRGGRSDSTMKFRQLDEIALPGDWGADDPPNESRYEGDWTGSKHQCSASVSRPVNESLFGSLPTLAEEWFTDAQRRLARHAADDLDVPWPSLEPLGPIYALRWELEKDVTGFDDKIVVEQWCVDGLSFLELSIRVDSHEAASWQTSFETFVEDKGLDVPVNQETKTATVLRYLSRRAHS